MSTADTSMDIAQKLNIYWGLIILVVGVFGNIWSILIFRYTSLRSNSSCFYMFIGAWVSLLKVLFGVTDRVMNNGFHLQWTWKNVIWCQTRYFISYCASQVALFCLLMSVIDRFWSTCQAIKWRRLNSINIAKLICSYGMIVFMLTAIPILLNNKRLRLVSGHQIHQCSLIFESNVVTNLLNLFFYGLFPWPLMIFFSLLTLRNIRRRHRRQLNTLRICRISYLDQQLVLMLFVQTIICTFSSLPYCIYILYDAATSTVTKDNDRQANEYLIEQIVHLCFYFNYIGMFYGYYLTSRLFRHISRQALRDLLKKQHSNSRELTIVHNQSNHQSFEFVKSRLFTILLPHPVSPQQNIER